MSRQGSTTLKGQLEYVLGSQEGLYDELLGQHETARHLGELISVFGKETELRELAKSWREPEPVKSPPDPEDP